MHGAAPAAGPPDVEASGAEPQQGEEATLAAPPCEGLPVVAPPPPEVRCPMCSRYRGPCAQGLVLHMAKQHAGHTLTEDARAVLRGLGRGICSCGFLRVASSRKCPRCHDIEPPRPAAATDVLPMSREGRRQRPVEPEPLHGNAFPERFLERVRALRGETMLHIPSQFREKYAQAWSANLAGIVEGDPRHAILEEVRPRLLLSMPPGWR